MPYHICLAPLTLLLCSVSLAPPGLVLLTVAAPSASPCQCSSRATDTWRTGAPQQSEWGAVGKTFGACLSIYSAALAVGYAAVLGHVRSFCCAASLCAISRGVAVASCRKAVPITKIGPQHQSTKMLTACCCLPCLPPCSVDPYTVARLLIKTTLL